jgi:hypothetical protein
VAVTGRNSDKDDDEQGAPSETPWYNRTPEVIGASVLGVLVIGILVFAVSYVARQFNEAPEAPLYYVEPSFSATATSTSSSTTTTQTITSTSPPITTDINGPSSTTTPSSSETTSGERIPPRTRESDAEDDGETRTTRRPRTNVTRTLYPQP